MDKKMKFKACEDLKTATDAACESKECLHSIPSCEEEKPHLWVNLLIVNAIACEQCLRRQCEKSIGCDEGRFTSPEECASAPSFSFPKECL